LTSILDKLQSIRLRQAFEEIKKFAAEYSSLVGCDNQQSFLLPVESLSKFGDASQKLDICYAIPSCPILKKSCTWIPRALNLFDICANDAMTCGIAQDRFKMLVSRLVNAVSEKDLVNVLITLADLFVFFNAFYQCE
jgi:hypothetical protein